QIEERAPQDAKRWRQKDPDFIPGGSSGEGESLITFSARVLKALDDIAAGHVGQQIAIVTHGGVLDVIYRAAVHLDFQAPRTWTLGNTCVSRLMWSPQGIRLVSWANTSHLELAKQGGISTIEPNAEF
ncbi:MAG: histidine phosphatase family protein, partial [Saezia sp.]